MKRKNVGLALVCFSVLLLVGALVSAPTALADEDEEEADIDVEVATQTMVDITPDDFDFGTMDPGEESDTEDLQIENIGSTDVTTLGLETSQPSEMPFGTGDGSSYDAGNFVAVGDHEDETYFVDRVEFSEIRDIVYLTDPEGNSAPDDERFAYGRFRVADEEYWWLVDTDEATCPDVLIGTEAKSDNATGTTDFSDADNYEEVIMEGDGDYCTADSAINIDGEDHDLDDHYLAYPEGNVTGWNGIGDGEDDYDNEETDGELKTKEEGDEFFVYSSSADDEVHKITSEGNNEWEYTEFPQSVWNLAVDQDGYVYAGSVLSPMDDPELHKITPEGDNEWVYEGHEDEIRGVAVDIDGYVYSASNDDEVHKIDSEGNNVWEYTEFDASARGLAVDLDGYVYSGSYDGEVHKIDSEGNNVWVYTGHEHEEAVQSVAVDLDGYVHTASDDGEVHKIDSEGNNVWVYTGHEEAVRSVAVDQDGYVYSGSYDGEVHKIDSEGNNEWVYTGHEGDVEGVSVDQDGNVYSGARTQVVHKIDSEGNNEWVYEGHEDIVYATAVDPGAYGAGFWEVDDDIPPLVETYEAEDITSDSATLQGNLTDTGDPEEVDLYFYWREEGAADWNEDFVEMTTEPTTYNHQLTDLELGTTYEFYAYAEGEHEGEDLDDEGDTLTFTTEDLFELTVDIFFQGLGEVNVSWNGENHTVTDSDTFEIEPDTDVTLEASSYEDYGFYDWIGDVEGEEKEIIVTIDEDKSLTARFRGDYITWETEEDWELFEEKSNVTVDGDTLHLEHVFQTDTEEESTDQTYTGDPAEWETHWEGNNVYVEEMEEMGLEYHYTLEGEGGVESGVRILVDETEVFEDTEDSLSRSEQETVTANVEGDDYVDVKFQVYSEEATVEETEVVTDSNNYHYDDDNGYWATHKIETNVDVSGLDNTDIFTDYALEAESHSQGDSYAGVRVEVDDDVVWEVFDTDIDVDDTHMETVNVEGDETVDIVWEYYTEEGSNQAGQSTVDIYETSYERTTYEDVASETTFEHGSYEYVSELGYEESGHLLTDVRPIFEAEPDLENLLYNLNGESVTLDVIGSPEGNPEEISVTLDGTEDFELDWSQHHEEFQIRVNLETTDSEMTPTLSSATLMGEPTLIVDTQEATNVGIDSATLNGELIDLGGADSAEVWFEWDTDSDLTDPNTTTSETMTETGSFDYGITDLEEDTTYHFRAVAENEDDTDYGDTLSFTTEESVDMPEVYDIEYLKDDETWVDNNDLEDFGVDFTATRVNCSSNTSIEETEISIGTEYDGVYRFKDEDYSYEEDGWYVYDHEPETVDDSGYWNASARCFDGDDWSDEYIEQWFVDWGELNVEMHSPVPGETTQVERYDTFEMNATVTCEGGECASEGEEVKVWADPYEEDITLEGPMKDGDTVEISDDFENYYTADDTSYNYEIMQDNPHEIHTIEDLYDVRDDKGSDYVLMNDLDFCEEDDYDDSESYPGIDDFCEEEGAEDGWDPIGDDNNPFTGVFDGQNNTVSNLFLDRGPTGGEPDGYGLFGQIDEAEVRDIGLLNADVTGEDWLVGILVGISRNSLINNTYTSGKVGGYDERIGGLVGENQGDVYNSFSESSVYWYGDQEGEGEIVMIGGLVGQNAGETGASIESSFAIGEVDTSYGSEVGGLVGRNSEASISDSYSQSNVSGNNDVGGFLGVFDQGIIENSYSTGYVVSDGNHGAFVGTFAAGPEGDYHDNFFDRETSGYDESDDMRDLGAEPKLTSEMQDIDTFYDTNTDGLEDPWNIVLKENFNPDDPSIWFIEDGDDYPRLFHQYIDVSTGGTLDITTDSAVLYGNLNEKGNYFKVDVWFEYREEGDQDWLETDNYTLQDTDEYSEEITNLASDTTYEYRSVASANPSATGEIQTFTTEEEGESFFEVDIYETNEPITEGEELMVNATIKNTGDVEDTQQIELYDKDWSNEVQDSEEITLQTGESENITLAWNTEDSDADTGDVRVESDDDHDEVEVEITTAEEISVETRSVTDIEYTSVTFHGELMNLGEEEQVDIFLQYRESGEIDWINTSKETVSSPQHFNSTVDSLQKDRLYEFRAYAENEDFYDTGGIKTFYTGYTTGWNTTEEWGRAEEISNVSIEEGILELEGEKEEGYLKTEERYIKGYNPDLKNLSYDLNDQEIVLNVTGSPGSIDEEVLEIDLKGQEQEQLDWTDTHDHFQVEIFLNVLNPDSPTFDSFSLEGDDTMEKNIIEQCPAEPFCMEQGDNPQTKEEVEAGETVDFDGIVNATGKKGNYTVFFFANSTNPNVLEENSDDGTVEISSDEETWIGLEISDTLSEGIHFDKVLPDTENNNATGNYGENGTEYYISVDPATNVDVDLYHSTEDQYLSSEEEDVLDVGNISHKANSTASNGVNLDPDGAYSLSDEFFEIGDGVCMNMEPEDSCWMRYWIDVPDEEYSGEFDTTYEYCGVESGVDKEHCQS